MVIIRPALRISGCAQGSSELSYRQVAARDYRVPEGIDRHSVNNKRMLFTFSTFSNGRLPSWSWRQEITESLHLATMASSRSIRRHYYYLAVLTGLALLLIRKVSSVLPHFAREPSIAERRIESIVQTTKDTRPTLMLHVGPPKTATTFLQCSICSDGPAVGEILAVNHYQYLGTCPSNCSNKSVNKNQSTRYIRHQYSTFFSRPHPEEPPILGPDFVQKLTTARATGKNVLLIFEDFHRLSLDHLQVLSQHLRDD